MTPASSVSTYQRRRAARRACEADDASMSVDAPGMALLRLGGVLDAMQRAGLAAARLVALADRLAAGYEVASDSALLDVLSAADLAAVNMTAPAFIIGSATPLRGAVAALQRAGIGVAALLIPSAAIEAGKKAAIALAERLRALPDAKALARIGDALEGGHVVDAELTVIRAIPAAYLRSRSSQRHWRVFTEYRDE